MNQELDQPTGQLSIESVHKALIDGDLAALTPEQQVSYYMNLCKSMGLNPMSKPFAFIKFQQSGKVIPYATKSCTEQLAKINNVNLRIISKKADLGLYVVECEATQLDNGCIVRQTTDVGAVNIETLKGEALANAIMKATTKAKRRATLSLLGLGFLDESETSSGQPFEFKTALPEPPADPAKSLDQLKLDAIALANELKEVAFFDEAKHSAGIEWVKKANSSQLVAKIQKWQTELDEFKKAADM